MAQVSLTLRPPPNVDFVHGFPGILPTVDRPQAVVKGALEVRVPPGGIKAKWVRIELRKIEQLPGGGPDTKFFDFVGQSPVNLWTTPDEYGVLNSQDFPFAIRIPESIPPSVELDNRGQISYELVASVCTKGKKGFLRKAKAVVKDAKAPITIDKHELHSTWPIYGQHEVRQISRDGLTLIVERNHSCFGPGDRIAVTATVKSDSLHTVVITGFELQLKEVMRIHPNNFVGVKKVETTRNEKTVAKQVMNSSATLYGGSQATVDLDCTLNPAHTTPTLTSARHMDINYTCIVQANLQNGSSIFAEIPVMISNWPRSASAQAIRQIGPVANLSLIPPTQAAYGQSPHNSIRPQATENRTPAINTMPLARPSTADTQNPGVGQFNTVNPAGGSSRGGADEFGYTGRPTTPPSRNTSALHTATGSTASPNTRKNRLTITNAPELTSNRPIAPSRNRPGSSGKQWATAEEEKRMYEEARKRVMDTQGPEAAPLPIGTPMTPPTQAQPLQNPTSSGSGSGGGSDLGGRHWPTAEEEKVALFKKAQEAALKHQDPGAFVPPTPTGSSQNAAPSGSSSGGGSKPSGAELYRQAMEARKNATPVKPPTGQATNSPSPQRANPPYLSAEQEKAALRRYEEAKRAADKTHGADASPVPVAYEALYPNNTPAPPPAASAPPPFPAGVASGAGALAILSEKERLRREYEARDAAALAAQNQPPPPPMNDPPPPPFPAGASGAGAFAILSEKERLKREYEARDAAALAMQNQATDPPPPPFTPTLPASPPPNNQFASAIAEKEALRRKFEERDRMAAAKNTPPPIAAPAPLYTPRSPPGTPSATGGGARPTPLPPAAGGSGSRILTAAEEKALLKARYEAKDAAAAMKVGGVMATPQPPPPRVNGTPVSANGNGLPTLPPHTFASPPPLMPRPPAEYIQETREEDDRVARTLAGDGVSVAALTVGALEVKPFTPFSSKFDPSLSGSGMPPMPPKSE